MKEFPFTIEDALIYAAIFLLSILLLILGIKYIGLYFPQILADRQEVLLYVSFFQQVFYVIPFIFLWKITKKKHLLQDLGFRNISIKTFLLSILVTFFTVVTVLAIGGILKEYFHINIPGWSGSQSNIFETFGLDGPKQYLIFILGGISAPILEEIVFRGLFLQVCLRYMPVPLAAILAAIIFSLAHMQLQVFLPLFIIGLGLSFLFIKTKSLYPGIAYHALNNLLTLFILLHQ